MERRNFLEIIALLGLSPMLPNLTKEQESPGIVETKTFDGEEVEFSKEVEFGETVDLSNNFKIEILNNITILKKKHGKYNISGKGFINDGTEVSWLIKVKSDGIGTNGKLFINGKDGYKVESVYQEASQSNEYFIDEAQYPIAIFPTYPPKTFMICKKI